MSLHRSKLVPAAVLAIALALGLAACSASLPVTSDATVESNGQAYLLEDLEKHLASDAAMPIAQGDEVVVEAPLLEVGEPSAICVDGTTGSAAYDMPYGYLVLGLDAVQFVVQLGEGDEALSSLEPGTDIRVEGIVGAREKNREHAILCLLEDGGAYPHVEVME